MKIISFIHNDISNTDFAVYLKDNYEDENSPQNIRRNTSKIVHTKNGFPVLQIEFWRNERFQNLFWNGEHISVTQDKNSDFPARPNMWLEFMEIFDGF